MSNSFSFTADMATVIDHLSDPDKIIDRALALGALEASSEVEGDDEQYTVTNFRQKEADVPSALKKILGSSQDVTSTESWEIGEDQSFCHL